MNILDTIAYVLVVLGSVRLLMTRGTCPGGWTSLIIGVVLLNRNKLL